MQNLIETIRSSVTENSILPFSVYTSVKEQNLLNVPVAKPLLISVLDGDKAVGKNGEITCHSGDFIFLSDNPAINMRNIPKEKEYFALLIEFDFQDFDIIKNREFSDKHFFVGEITFELKKCLQQFVEWALWAPKQMWPLRRKEIIQLLYHMGHKEILSMIGSSKVSQRIHSILNENPSEDISLQYICKQLAVSESTLRRKLKTEGASLQNIKDQVRQGLGLHLLQTTNYSISYIAEQCGYQSQSRFTSRFKDRFGLTPSELRKTKLTDSSGTTKSREVWGMVCQS
ncbi:MAG: helix-turn-helix domain-containing protein [Endozoicomonas sp.]